MIDVTDHLSRPGDSSMRDIDALSDSMAGATIGHLEVLTRQKPAKRVFYVCRDIRDESVHRLRGYELVRRARDARRDDLAVVLAKPWRDEPGAA